MKIIKINAVWCPSCLYSKSIWKEVQNEYPNFEYVDLDYDLDEDIVTKYNVGTILPVVIFEEDNIEIKRLIGEKSKKEIIKEVSGLRWKGF